MANVSRGYGYDPDDKTTWAYYSIMLYYTPEVEENVEDLIGFIQQVRAETNQGKTPTLYLQNVQHQL